MELLSGCAIITAHEKAVNRIQILVVGRTPPVRPRRQRRLFLSPLKCIAGGKAGLTVPHSGWVIAPNSAWQQGQNLQQKRLKSQDFRRFHGITTNPLSSSMALVVLLPSPRPVHGHCRSAFATGASARYSSGCISSFPNLPPQRKSPRAFLRIPVPCCFRRAACMAPIFQITTCSLIRQYSVTGGCFPSAGLAVRLRLHGFGKVDAVLHIAQVLVHCGGGRLLVIAHDS